MRLFRVRRFTESFQETLDYLVRMTTHLTAKYKSRDLKIFNQSQMDNVFTFGLSSQSLDSNAFESGQLGNPSTPTQRITHDTTVTLVSPLYRPLFQDFSRLHTKTLFLTQRDLYIKQLTCILHVTTEKALAISQLYPTLRQLLDAYERLDDFDRPYMLKDVKVMVGEDKGIGDKLSRKIYENFYGN